MLPRDTRRLSRFPARRARPAVTVTVLREATMKRRWFRTALALSFVVLAGWVPLIAQTHFASFTGTITSRTGIRFRTSRSSPRMSRTQVTYAARSNDSGLYTISALPIGTYKSARRRRAFRSRDEPHPRSSPARTRASTSRCRSASSRAGRGHGVRPILQTQDAVVGEVVSETTIEGMPLNGRNFSQLSLLLPGVVTTEPEQLHRAQELRVRDGRS